MRSYLMIISHLYYVATQRKRKSSASSSSFGDMPPLLNLGRLIQGTLIKRPSAAIRSPYVADVSLHNNNSQSRGKKNNTTSSTILAHAPALDVGGMCVEGSDIYLTKRDGEGKTSHSIELVRGAPLVGNNDNGVLVGAHPRLGELIAEQVLKLGLLQEALPLKDGFVLGPPNDFTRTPAKKKLKSAEDDSDLNTITQSTNSNERKINLQQQVTLGDSRVDFQMTLSNGKSQHRVVIEVKNVVCADYEAGKAPQVTGPGHCVVVAPPTKSVEDDKAKGGYKRSALFPWGKTKGQKFDNKTVVSERACKHLRNLESLQLEKDTTSVVLFIINREDCESFRACREKCPVFAEILDDVVKAGEKPLAVRVRWTEDGDCYFDGMVPVKLNNTT